MCCIAADFILLSFNFEIFFMSIALKQCMIGPIGAPWPVPNMYCAVKDNMTQEGFLREGI